MIYIDQVNKYYKQGFLTLGELEYHDTRTLNDETNYSLVTRDIFADK